MSKNQAGATDRRRLGVLVLLVGLCAAACGSTSATTTGSGSGGGGGGGSATTVRLGYFPNITHAPALVGIQKGLFQQKLGGAKLETKSFDAGPEATEALFSEALDITYIGPNPSINAFQKSKGEAVRVVSGSTSGGAYFVTKPEINSAQDLKGKSVSTPQLGNTQDVALRTWLKGQGLSADASGGGDVSIKPQENANTLNAFKAGEIVGAWVPEPWATRLIQEGGGKVLVDEKTLWPDGRFDTTNILVRKKFLDENPDLVKKVLEAHLASLDYIKTDPEGAKSATNEQINAITQKKLPDAVINQSWTNLQFTADPIASSIKKSAEDAVAVGQLKSADIKGIFDLTQLNAALKAAGQAEVPTP